MTRNTRSTAAALLAAALLLAGCKQQAPNTQADQPDAQAATWILTEAPETATGVAEAKASAREGDPIVLRGIIGGTLKPISDDSPVFRIIDTGVHNRCTAEKDHCPTPWDYCCAAPEQVTANSATIQVVDANGSPVTSSITTGLSPLDEVIVVGTVAARPNDQVLTVRATGIHRIGG